MDELIYQKFGELQPDQNFTRAGKLFKTKNHTYFYDSGTGKVFECEGPELMILETLLKPSGYHLMRKLLDGTEFEQAFYNIMELVNEEHILQRKVCDHVTDDEDTTCLQQITLELTQACNLRCKYCIYNGDFDKFRDFSAERISWGTAKKALDYAAAHCGSELTVGFYGGEPLLEFAMIQSCVDYCHMKFKGVKLIYTLTTNLTLVTKEIADYLSSIDAKIVCSLDGPSDIQDRFRVFQTGNGSHERAVKGLKLLVEAYGTKASTHLSVHSVVCPPYTKENLDHIKSYFEGLDWLPEEMPFDLAYVDSGSLKEQDGGMIIKHRTEEEFYNDALNVRDPIKYWALNDLCDYSECKSKYLNSVCKRDLLRMHLRSISHHPSDKMFRNGCCNPGVSRVYVDVKGNYKVCEKIGITQPIGNVNDGVDFCFIEKNYKENFDVHIVNRCNDCWAVYLCNLCYCNCYDEENFNENKKDRNCIGCRSYVENNLIMYYQILEENPGYLEEIDKYIQTQT